MFIGEAPGRLGAGRTGIPFSGDVSGQRFELLLSAAGLLREEVFITNAVRCLPLDGNGRNRTPRATEIRECSSWLSREISIVQPSLVIALGGVALEALARIEPHGLALGRDFGKRVPWFGRELVTLYHPGARSAVHRRWELQLEDWRRLTASEP